jgi:hypothetical protein
MEQQLSIADIEYHHKRNHTRKEKFLARMEELVPWQRLEAVVEPHYPKAGSGRRPYLLMTMRHIQCMQQWHSMNDPAMEGCTVRDRLDAAVCGALAGPAHSGSHHDYELPTFAGTPWLGAEAL